MTLGSNRPCVKCGAQDRNKRGNCKPCARKSARKWQRSNREKVAEYQREWREANVEKLRNANRKYREDNAEKVREARLDWRKANPEKCRDGQQAWKKENLEKVKISNRNRRARKKGNGGKLSSDIGERLMVLQKGKCACCGKSLNQGYHLDHIMPLALGGKNDDSNVQLLAPKCNLSKGAKHPDDYMRSKGKLI